MIELGELPIVQLPSPNFGPRQGWEPIAIVIHTMGGNLAGSDSWFTTFAADSQTSAHYGVGLNGEIHQYVNLSQSAWANGVLEHGNKWPLNINPNLATISIETEDHGNPHEPVTSEQLNAVAYCCKVAIEKYSTIGTLMTHRAISPSSRVNCPGTRWTSGPIQQLAALLDLELIL